MQLPNPPLAANDDFGFLAWFVEHDESHQLKANQTRSYNNIIIHNTK
jgi:hypothetical protein